MCCDEVIVSVLNTGRMMNLFCHNRLTGTIYQCYCVYAFGLVCNLKMNSITGYRVREHLNITLSFSGKHFKNLTIFYSAINIGTAYAIIIIAINRVCICPAIIIYRQITCGNTRHTAKVLAISRFLYIIQLQIAFILSFPVNINAINLLVSLHRSKSKRQNSGDGA